MKADDLLARLELIRAAIQDESAGEGINEEEKPSENAVLLANASYVSVEPILDPWKRTVSHLSMSFMQESDFSSCRVGVVEAGTGGPFYDRHVEYSVSVSGSVLCCALATGAG